MRTVTILDTSVASDNLGDQIILEAVRKVIAEVMPDAYTYHVATHEFMTRASKALLAKSDMAFVAGTNILASNMEACVLWKLYPWDGFAFDNAVLLGCGWLNYMKAPNGYSKWLLSKVLSSKWQHAVRDTYTLEKLGDIGRSAVNTSCPTMWGLTPEHCRRVSKEKGRSVVTNLTFYQARPELDRPLLELLKDRYAKVYFWPQQQEDMAYFEALAVSGIEIVNPSVAAFDQLLEGDDVDMVGTRLHAGIRGLQKLRRALILSVDNRATEISKDTGLPVVARGDLAAVQDWIDGAVPLDIRLPDAAIAGWKAQFGR